MDVQLEEGRGGFKERSVAVGKQAALQKQLQDLQRSYQVSDACLVALVVVACYHACYGQMLCPVVITQSWGGERACSKHLLADISFRT